ncbi:helix-turn-helix domain-containing protein [Silvimonas iriomotensis]|uniref:Helix-turn-helix domain-containing protein n=1 Tax=Silvimonas iriomotensis TaxID=449662 RepID=A0ABQ2PCG9_9NEIS|nr:helix-turn-helix domain-containing protein [Silvimonas iriomotensis]GGP23233.1 hypothetical protein GCM10010970_32330 [Silvimonas iriomotensis]
MFMEAKDVAQLLCISVKTLDKIIGQHEGPPFLRVGRIRRWRREDVLEWIEQQTRQHGKQSKAMNGN